MIEIYLAIVGAIGTVIGGFSGWFFRRRYENATASEKEAEAESKKIDNEIKLSDHYKKNLDELEQKYEARYAEQAQRYETRFNDMCKLFEQKEKILQDEISLLNRKNKMLSQENLALRKKLKKYEG